MIVSTAKLHEEIKSELQAEIPSQKLIFHHGMKEAIGDLERAKILITYGEDLTNELVEKAHALKWIMVISAGLDRMPFDSLEKRNILITNARGIHKTPMAEYTIAMMLQISRQARTLFKNQADHVWNRKVPMTEISGKTVGVLGTGAIGEEVARLAKAFRMNTIGFNRTNHAVSYFDEMVQGENVTRLYKESDFIVNILPSTPLTKQFIGKSAFRSMKSHAVFINIGRGTTVNEQEMIAALQNREIGHAVLDVFEKEPLDIDSPLWDMENVTITPHLSGITPDYQKRAIEIFLANYERFTNDRKEEMINIIPYDRGY